MASLIRREIAPMVGLVGRWILAVVSVLAIGAPLTPDTELIMVDGLCIVAPLQLRVRVPPMSASICCHVLVGIEAQEA